MVLDTSVLVSILLNEPGADTLEDVIDGDSRRLMSAASVLETAIVLQGRFGEDALRELDLIIQRVPITIVPFDSAQLEWARHAFQRFGRGRHRAALNFGDCFSYALAKTTGEPLLYKGSDFCETDVASVRYRD